MITKLQIMFLGSQLFLKCVKNSLSNNNVSLKMGLLSWMVVISGPWFCLMQNSSIFLVASVDERAERRYKENVEKGITADLELLKKRNR